MVEHGRLRYRFGCVHLPHPIEVSLPHDGRLGSAVRPVVGGPKVITLKYMAGYAAIVRRHIRGRLGVTIGILRIRGRLALSMGGAGHSRSREKRASVLGRSKCPIVGKSNSRLDRGSTAIPVRSRAIAETVALVAITPTMRVSGLLPLVHSLACELLQPFPPLPLCPSTTAVGRDQVCDIRDT